MKGWLEERRDGAVEVWTCMKLKKEEKKRKIFPSQDVFYMRKNFIAALIRQI